MDLFAIRGQMSVPNPRRSSPAPIGVISDTHGLLRPEAVQALTGSSLIIHAGDLGDPEILTALRKIAPVVAVRGNIDRGEWAATLPEYELIEHEGVSLYVLHDINQLDLDPVAAGVQAVISGHSHKPSIRTEAGVLYLNPGSAGPRRFTLPVTVARLHVRDRRLEAEGIDLLSGSISIPAESRSQE
jgi:putative phosphoesterase